MDYNERAKNTPYNIEKEIPSFKEKTDEKWELRKKHNQNIIMAERRKRIIQLSQNNKNENIFLYDISDNNLLSNKLDNDLSNENNFKIQKLLNENDLLIKLPPLNNISNNINEILKYLSSDNIDENKWIIHSLRVYFQKDNIPYNEYSILFDNNIHIYLERLLNKYKYDNSIINEIFFIITDFFDNDNNVYKYPINYFEYFLNDNYYLIYQKYISLQNGDSINNILILLRNILVGKSDLIKNFYNKRKEIFYHLLDYFSEKRLTSIEIVKNYIFFISIIFQELNNTYITDLKLFNRTFDTIFMIYKNISLQKKDVIIIKHIIYIFRNFLSLKFKDFDVIENDDYYVINYLFNGYNKNMSFIQFFLKSLLKDSNFYFNDISLLIISLDLLGDITFYSSKYQIQILLEYNIFTILNIMFYFKNNFSNLKFQIVSKILNISNNIIDSDITFSKIYIKTEIFDNLVKFFSINMNNNKIVDNFLDTFLRLLNYYDKQIADNLNKRGIIKDGILNSFQYMNNNNQKEIKKKCKIISSYLYTVYDPNQKNGFNKEDYLICYKFKEMLELNQINLPYDFIDVILKLDFMNLIGNKFE